MKILHLLGTHNLPQNPDNEGVSGVVRAALELARAQATLGHHTTVAVAGMHSWRTLWRGVQLVSLKAAPWARLSIQGRALDLSLHLPYVLLSQRLGPDFVHGHIYSYMRLIRARQRLVHFHSDPFYPGGNNEGYDLKPADIQTIDRYSQAQIAVSQFVAEELKRGFGKRGNIHTVYNGVDPTFFHTRQVEGRQAWRNRWGAGERDTVFLFAGAIIKEKGVIYLAQAFARLAAKQPSVKLVVAGAGNLWGRGHRPGMISAYEQQVQQQLIPLVAAGRVHLLNKIAAGSMADIYAAADVIVVPSVWREAFGLVAVEALASARPVIASRTGGLPEIVTEDHGMLVAPEDENALEEAMAALADNSALRSVMGMRGQHYARRFSWSTAADLIEQIYRQPLTA